MMLGVEANVYYKITWLVVSPLTLLVKTSIVVQCIVLFAHVIIDVMRSFQCVIVFLFVNYVPPQYGDYEFPPYALSIGWALALCPCTLIPLTMVFMLLFKSGGWSVS